MPEVVAIESTRAELRLEPSQAVLLRALGRELSANRGWWGEGQDVAQKSVINVQLLGDETYAITFRDVVGVVRVGDLQIRVSPKIPSGHFSYLIRHSELAPRTARQVASIDPDEDYASLLALWCVMEAETLLRRGLRADYNDASDELDEVRGRIEVVATALANHSGRAVAYCEYDDFTDDTSLNRVIKAACQLVATCTDFPRSLRRRAHRVASRMTSVGHLQGHDRFTRLTRLTKIYSRAFPLARLMLEGGGVASRTGALTGRAFLLRTPELIEDAIRNIVLKGLDGMDVRKRRLLLGNSGVSINPDLVFAHGLAVGDVKYRHLGADWDRASLYQVVAFATGFGSNHCGMFGFTVGAERKLPPAVPVGKVLARAFAWNAHPDIAPEHSAHALGEEVSSWLAGAGAASLQATGS